MNIAKQKPSRSARRLDRGIFELNHAQLKEVAGGINPQPLPPRHDD